MSPGGSLCNHVSLLSSYLWKRAHEGTVPPLNLKKQACLPINQVKEENPQWKKEWRWASAFELRTVTFTHEADCKALPFYQPNWSFTSVFIIPVLLILFLRKSQPPFLANKFNVFLGKGSLGHVTFNYPLNAVKTEQWQVICQFAVDKADERAYLFSEHFSFSRSTLILPLRF